MKHFYRLMKKSEKGQVLIIVALTLTALIAIIGLAIDTGYLYVSYARLRRAVDAAALAGSSEFKRNTTTARLQAAATQMLYLNLDGPQTANSSTFPIVDIESCPIIAVAHGIDPTTIKANLTTLQAYDQAMLSAADWPSKAVCTLPMKKMVRVTVKEMVPFFFLQVVPGIPHSYAVQVTSLSEAATVDVMLALDTSDSMTVGWPGSHLGPDDKNPAICNADDPTGGADGIPGSCMPFQDVKKAAYLFLNNLFFPYDRVGVVTFDKTARMQLELSDDYDLIKNTILYLKVYEGNQECPYTRDQRPGDPKSWPPLSDSAGFGTINPCRFFTGPTETPPHSYIGMDCPMMYGPEPNEDGSSCGNTNIGDGVALSGSILTGTYDTSNTSRPVPAGGWPLVRDDSLWVLLLLTDGASNTGTYDNGGKICPKAYNVYAWNAPLCRDDNALVRHCYQAADTDCVNAHLYSPPTTTSSVDAVHYDPDDRARDMFDIVSRNNTLIFTIGMGDAQKVDGGWAPNGVPPGETLMKYGAFGTTNDMTNTNALKGLYNFGANAADLNRIFLAIANNLATRINQ